MATNLVKRSGESRLYVFDLGYQPELATGGDTISAVSSVAFTPNGLTVGASSIVTPPVPPTGSGVTGAGVQVRVSSGVNGVTYQDTCTVTTTLGNTLVGLGTLQIRDT